jgi:hypothetical protein
MFFAAKPPFHRKYRPYGLYINCPADIKRQEEAFYNEEGQNSSYSFDWAANGGRVGSCGVWRQLSESG